MTDISALGFGFPWGQSRTYSNQQSTPLNRGIGWNWNPNFLPYLAYSPLVGASLALYRDLYDLRFYGEDPDTGEFQSQFGDLSILVYDAEADRFQLTEPDGTVYLFNSLSDPYYPGGFISMTSPGGTTISVTSESFGKILEVQRATVIDSVTVTDSFLYDYFSSGDNHDQMESCTYRRQTGSGGDWTNISRVVYSYYDSVDDNGNLNDLRTATRSTWQASGSGSWAETGTDYYRYYKDNLHLLKFVCGPQAFANLSDNTPDPFTASDLVVSLYADYYYQYDSNQRVTLERVYAGSKTITFAYQRNPRHPLPTSSSSASPAALDHNTWVFKTTETLPDNSQTITYANYAGQTMLSVTAEGTGSSSSSGSGPRQWCTFFQYNDQGQVLATASPSAVLGYDDSHDDLLHYMPELGKYEYLRDNAGLINLNTYYTAGSGQPEGFLAGTSLVQGQLGTPVPQQSLQYTTVTAGGTPIYLVSTQTSYPSDTTTSITIETSIDYTYYTDTAQVQQKTITLPVISTSQNGSGTANVRQEYYDEFGYLTWTMDERGFITHFVYDAPTGGVIRRIDDVNTSLVTGAPAGWTTPFGGGLNLVTDYELDDQGRTTQELGPVHTVDVGGTATSVRTAAWMVYDDPNHTVRVGRGYATGFYPTYTYTLVNPVTIRIADKVGKPLDDIQAVRSTSGRLSPTDTFSQGSYVRWTTYQYTDCCLLESQRQYRLIPTSGIGSPGTNYDETTFGYDVMKRRNQTITPGGTINFTVFDVRNQPVQLQVGTNNTSANNMVVVTENGYDNGLAGGDGNLTEQVQWVDGATTRTTQFEYDWRNRLIVTDGEVDYCEQRTYDNLNRVTQVDRYDTTIGGNLIGQQVTAYDDLSRTYQTTGYAVNPGTGDVGNGLVNNIWYDPVGNVAKQFPAGSALWSKTTYDSLNRPTVRYSGYGTDSTYDDIFSVADDVVMEQSEFSYDDAGNIIQTTIRQRYHNAPDSQTGALKTPTLSPAARVTYAANYPDAVGRPQAGANYGTNGGSPLSRPNTIPARFDTVLVGSQSYDNAGNLSQTTDPAGMITSFSYDAAGRRLTVVENAVTWGSSSSSSSSSGSGCLPSDDANRTTQFTYNADGQVSTLIAVNADTTNQVTTYYYGTTLADSNIASSLLLRSVAYPDSTSGSDQVWLAYNRQSQRTTLTDQNGTVHSYNYDLLGRPTQDRVTTLASGVDGAIRRIETAYEVRGMVNRVSSLDSASVGLGGIVNEVRWTYNDFSQSIETFQSHSGAVNTPTTPSVQQTYADGSENTIRPTSLLYPNGRTLAYNYGTAGGIDDSVSRISNYFSGVYLAFYRYLGLGTVVQQDSTQASLQYTLVSPTNTIDPDTGDIYAGLDRFGRVKDCRWRNTATGDDLSRVQYGYNRASSRTWRANPTDPDQHYDWLYGYDGLQRVTSGKRGTLNGTHTAITDAQFGQCWTLDSTGNWQGFRQDDTGSGTWSLVQTRTANPVNEITSINASIGQLWANPEYDSNGNMTRIPRPGLTPPSWGNLTKEQWSTLTKEEWAGMEVAPTFRATYDAWNRLVTLTEGGTGQAVQQNLYDGRNYRIVRQSYTTGSLTETRHYYYTDGWQDVEERLGTSPDSATANRQFVWGLRYIDDLICRDRSVTGSLDERLYGCQDANWNMTAVVDTTGAVQERYEYDPYGDTTALSDAFVVHDASEVDWETTYAGYRWDEKTRIFAVRNRFYQPFAGAWVTRDPIGYDGGVNLYQYLFGRPIDGSDALGLIGPGNGLYLPGITPGLPGPQYVNYGGTLAGGPSLPIVPPPPPGVTFGTYASGLEGNQRWLFTNPTGGLPANSNKCSMFVAEAANAYGYAVPNVNRGRWDAFWNNPPNLPPVAGQWLNPKYPIPNWRPLGADEALRPGDVIAAPIQNPQPGATGHVGIYIGGGKTVSSSSIAKPAGTIAISDWPRGNPKAVARRYTPLPQGPTCLWRYQMEMLP